MPIINTHDPPYATPTMPTVKVNAADPSELTALISRPQAIRAEAYPNNATLLKESAKSPVRIRLDTFVIDKRNKSVPAKASFSPRLCAMVEILLMTNKPQPVTQAKIQNNSQKSILRQVIQRCSDNTASLGVKNDVSSMPCWLKDSMLETLVISSSWCALSTLCS
mmetsp:Transcript_16245/g.23900  ORF Transcript_16245/g.23900 Transcript_16245/m.23900 type:complete len:165 (-) Transcript_16245:801-1295(-)